MGVVSRFSCALLLTTAPLAAWSSEDGSAFKSTPITVNGSSNVEARGLNEKGAIVASVYGLGGQPVGVVLSGGTVTTLTPPYEENGAVHPTQIDNRGNILGWAGRGTSELPNLFYYKDGQYKQAYNIALNVTFMDSQVAPFGISSGGNIFLNEIYQLDGAAMPKYGKPKNLTTVPFSKKGTLMYIESMNSSGVIAGFLDTYHSGQVAVTGSASHLKHLLPPGAKSSGGGFINDSGAVAGSWVDANDAQHGFIYSGGSYTSFDMPEAASGMNLTAFNSKGRVAGVYISQADTRQHVFLFNGTTTSAFGNFPLRQDVEVALNNKSDLVVAVGSSAADWKSFALKCKGNAC